MRIACVQSMPNYKGIVNKNGIQINEAIRRSPMQTRVALRENIDLLCAKLEDNTPDDRKFNLEFEESDEQKDENEPRYYYGIIRLKSDDGTVFENKFNLGYVKSSARNIVAITPSKEKLWMEGFENIAKRTVGE